METIHSQINTIMIDQTETDAVQSKKQKQKSLSTTQQITTNNQMTADIIALEAGRGLDREGGNYQC